ncbi:hypothetical protein [Lacisediminihabitans sp.]|jgi:nitroreductase|uniref:hypothetical protein n=1 Tax=Lacisediminihabitans sp. TaxID=2787631 RepID=UPI002F921134
MRFRAWPGAIAGSVEIRNIGASRSFKADSLSVARHVSTGGTLNGARTDSEVDLGEFEKWDEYGWSDAIPFYISTLDLEYSDVGNDFRNQHAEVLSTYANSSPLPSERYPMSIDKVQLPKSPNKLVAPDGEVLRRRRTTLVPDRTPLHLNDLAEILSEATKRLVAFRTPSLASDPLNAMVNFGPSLDVYCAVYEVTGLEAGIYRYDLRDSSLILLSRGNFREEMRIALVGQPAPITAAVTVLYVSEIHRHQWRYRHARALRGLWIDGAKVVNHLLWSLSRRDITPHMSPAVNDSLTCEIMGLDPDLDNEVVYTVSFGGPKRSGAA